MNTPEQRRAYGSLQGAIKSGKVKRHEGACQICDRNCKHTRIVAHHYKGYDYPLDVWWICSTCNHLLRHTHDGSLTLNEAREIIQSNPLSTFCKKCHNEKISTRPIISRYRG